jgi:hypothetical protein
LIKVQGGTKVGRGDGMQGVYVVREDMDVGGYKARKRKLCISICVDGCVG